MTSADPEKRSNPLTRSVALFKEIILEIERVNLLYVLLVLSIFANFILPIDTLLNIENAAARYLLVSVLAFLPIFLANIVFTRSFSDTHTADIAFGSNLLGAMVFGTLEYVALVSGYQALLLVALGIYLLAYLTFRTPGYAAE
jgi:hypothetical protein